MNNQLMQAVIGISETVKGLESRLGAFERAFVNSAPSPATATTSPAFSPVPSHPLGTMDPSATPSISSAFTAQPTGQSSIHVGLAPSASQFNLSTAVAPQVFGRRFVPPAAVSVSHQLRSNIVEGKDVNLAALLIPSPTLERQMVDCGDVAVLLKTSDSRLQRNLSFPEFVNAFGIFRDILCQTFPDRREELDIYLAMMADFYQRYGGTLFYEYHRSFSAKSASFITLFNVRLDWSVTDTELLVRHFGGQRTLSCVICSSHGHSASLCPKTLASRDPAAVHGADSVSPAFDVRGRPIIFFNNNRLCNNFNESVCTYPKCIFSHICSFCKEPHPKFVCPRRFRPATRETKPFRKKF